MAFLNIVSLPAKIDELRYSMSNNLIDLIAFNETRLHHIVTNTSEKISDSGVIHTGISDHSLVFAVRKIYVVKKTNILLKFET